MMEPSAVYSEAAFAKYGALVNQALDVHAQGPMAGISVKQQIKLAIGGLQPSCLGALATERLSDADDWQTYWQVIHALEEQFKQSEVLTRAAIASASAQKKYADEFRKVHPTGAAAAVPAVIKSIDKVPATVKTEWQMRKQPKHSNKTEM